MDQGSLVGGGLLVAGLLGYVAGVYVPYPGRAFSLTAVMVGTALLLIGRSPTEAAE